MSKVLVVEDNLSQREMISALLCQEGLEVISVRDGQEALDQMSSHMPDVVVLDIIMPKMNGYEVCRRLRENPATARMPIVLCSSKGEDFDVHWGIKQGADAYISKPFVAQELIRTVKGLLKNSAQRS
jgi:twitching motility two-component system response regulator PilH